MTGRIVSVSTALFDGYPMEQAIGEIAIAGGRHVEPAYIRGYVDFDETAFATEPARRMKGSIAAAGLSVHAISAHMDLSGADAGEALRRRIDFAAAIGAKVLITNAGPATGRDSILTVIEEVLPMLEGAGIMLALENPGHGNGDLIGNAVEGSRLIDTVGSPSVRLNHDAGNVFTYSLERLQPAADFSAARDAIGHVHLKDVKSTPEGWSFTAIGDGDVALGAYLKALPQDMPLSIELPLRLSRPGRADPKRNAERVSLEAIRERLVQSMAFIAAADNGGA